MFNRRQSKKRNRPYAVKKTGFKDENIDRQIMAIHKKIAHKLLEQPELIEQVKQRLEQQRDDDKIGYGQFITWYSILELANQPDAFIAAMVEDTSKMRRLRRKTPFVGILTEEERQQALSTDATGYIDSIEVLL